jgi:hypothetical protein
MHFIKLNYDDAIDLQNQGQITILDVSKHQLQPVDNQYGKLWKDNFDQLLIKTPHVSPDKILDHYSAKYVCELVETIPYDECYQHTWRYLYGIQNKQIIDKTSDNIEYVYILVNDGYKNLVKIGMTIATVSGRVAGLNASSTVDEWQPKFAVAVQKGTAYRIEQQMHKAFAHLRVSSDKGASREFFTVDCLSAFDKLREIASLHMVGNPIVY